MIERRKKPTLEQMRTLYPFDVPTLARQAGVETDTLYYALLERPILRNDAEKIIMALSQHTGLRLSFDHIDIIVWEEFLMLWLVRAYADEPAPTGEATEEKYHFVYAQDQQHAATLAGEWLKQHPQLPHHSFTACPEGFRIGDMFVPGRQPRSVE
ncbi:hypothetical protein KSF_066300 [Reticulibacter mediterranei]|uniref:Uncharacterized protein n=1 Tax=Reticulibacter mediterranei TaxID=2778369 RepID=A0A8J3ITL9_9CHLR|nr:hypothetical protein [Reticulibacter mediterranei]GHO96582.1 hypothetical protein KSF_066300 [Reticulibacter mediterranei]